MTQALVNGEFVPLEEASVSILDRGFLFADGVYEVVPVYAGKPFRLVPHLERLGRSLDGIRMKNPFAISEWITLCNSLVERNGGGNLALYLQVTRGPTRQREHSLPKHSAPTVVGFCQDLKLMSREDLQRGIAAVLVPDDRWTQCWIKSVSLLPNVLAKDAAHMAGGLEAILSHEGLVTEGASTNVFAVFGGRAFTPPLSPGILQGITREVLVSELDIEESDIEVEQLPHAEEIWIASSTLEVLPVTCLDGNPVGGGRVGQHWARAHEALQAAKNAELRGD